MEFGILYQEEIRDSATTKKKKIHEPEVKLQCRKIEEGIFLRLGHSVHTCYSVFQGVFKT